METPTVVGYYTPPPKSIKLCVVENEEITDVYVHENIYNYREVVELLSNFCDSGYQFDCGLTRERLYQFMLGKDVVNPFNGEAIEDIVGYVAISLLDEFKHYKKPDFFPSVNTDYSFAWFRNAVNV